MQKKNTIREFSVKVPILNNFSHKTLFTVAENVKIDN